MGAGAGAFALTSHGSCRSWKFAKSRTACTSSHSRSIHIRRRRRDCSRSWNSRLWSIRGGSSHSNQSIRSNCTHRICPSRSVCAGCLQWVTAHASCLCLPFPPPAPLALPHLRSAPTAADRDVAEAAAHQTHAAGWPVLAQAQAAKRHAAPRDQERHAAG